MDADLLLRSWWSTALRGAVGIIFGLAVFIWPQLTVEILLTILGAFILVGGIFSIIAAIATRWGWPLVVHGLLGIIVGLITLFFPMLTAMVIMLVIAAWALIAGIMEIALATRFKPMLPGAWLVIVTGILSIIFALVVALNPGLGVQVLTQVFGIYAVIAGALLFGFALHLRGLQKPNGHGTWVSKGLG